MMFSSNTEMAKHYLKECLADGKEHSREELVNYVLAQTSNIELLGEKISESIIGSALWSMKNVENICENSRRGIYKLTDVDIETGTTAIFIRISKIVDKAIDDIGNSFIVDVGKLNISDAELLTAQDYAEKIKTFLQEIKHLSDDAIAEIDEINSDEDHSMQFM